MLKNIRQYFEQITARQHSRAHMMLIIGFCLLFLFGSIFIFGIILTIQAVQSDRSLANEIEVSRASNIAMVWQDDIQTIRASYITAQLALQSDDNYNMPVNTYVFTFTGHNSDPVFIYPSDSDDSTYQTALKIILQLPAVSSSIVPTTISDQSRQLLFEYGTMLNASGKQEYLVVFRPYSKELAKIMKSDPNILSFWTEDPNGSVIVGLSNQSVVPADIKKTYQKNFPRALEAESGFSYVKTGERYILYRNLSHIQSKIYFVLNTDYFTNPGKYYILFGVLSILLLTVSISIYQYFKKNVYLPIVQIEKAVKGIVDEDMEELVMIAKENEFSEFADNINSITIRVREILQREYNSRILRTQAEISALQSQISPHFLYNTLDSIRGQALTQGSYEVANLIKSLSNIFKYSINRSTNIVTLGDELRHIDNYLTIQQYRFNNKFQIIKNIDEFDLLTNCQIPKLTIQPIVENAIFHGLEKKADKGTIEIRGYATETRLIIEVEDDGVGMDEKTLQNLNSQFESNSGPIEPPDNNERGSSIALVNVNQRIKLLYGQTYGLKIFSTINEGTTVQIALPYILK